MASSSESKRLPFLHAHHNLQSTFWTTPVFRKEVSECAKRERLTGRHDLGERPQKWPMLEPAVIRPMPEVSLLADLLECAK
jgi:hypothetical protein